jgi:hypothetical protein
MNGRQPPGTGKTKTIIEAVKLLKHHFQVPHPILVCTYTNVAVDNLCEGFAQDSLITPLRVGYGGKVKHSLYKYTLDHELSLHPLKPKVDALEKREKILRTRLSALGARIKALSKKGREERRANALRDFAWTENKLTIVRATMYGLRQKMLQSVIGKADVVSSVSEISQCLCSSRRFRFARPVSLQPAMR